MRRHLFLSALFPLVILGCPSETPAVCDNGACDQNPDGSTPDGTSPDDGGTDGTVPVPADCDPNADPKDAPKCVVNDYGIFVDAASGNDNNSGSKELPVKSIGGALKKLNGRPRIYVCEGTYAESVKLTSPISIYGGFACGTWTYSGAAAKINTSGAVTLSVVGVNGVRFSDLDVEGAADPKKAGDSAVAIFVANSSDVLLRRVNATATGGTLGADGEARTNYSGIATKGGDATGGDGGSGPMCTCSDMTKSAGGNGASGVGAGMTDGSAEPAVGAANSGATKTTSCDPGLSGANGLAGVAASAATSPGKVDAAGWVTSAPAANASNGRPGQGGGGAGAKTNTTSPGGAGGCGGCGGAGGSAGGNGGSSFALISFSSSVVIEGGKFTSGAAGSGGAGADGQDGQTGGAPGLGAACDGGSGGNGAGGGGGAGGAGGYSAPIAFVGTEPQVNGTALTVGAKGSGGSGGAAGAGNGNPGASGPNGPDGKSGEKVPL